MKTYPVAVDTKDLMKYLGDRKNIAWALLDGKGNVLSKGGDEDCFDLNKVNIGQYLPEHFLCLEGLLPLAGTPYEIYELELLPNKFINVYCLPTKEGDKIVFHDISEMANIKSMVHEKTQEIMVFLDNYQRNTK